MQYILSSLSVTYYTSAQSSPPTGFLNFTDQYLWTPTDHTSTTVYMAALEAVFKAGHSLELNNVFPPLSASLVVGPKWGIHTLLSSAYLHKHSLHSLYTSPPCAYTPSSQAHWMYNQNSSNAWAMGYVYHHLDFLHSVIYCTLHSRAILFKQSSIFVWLLLMHLPAHGYIIHKSELRHWYRLEETLCLKSFGSHQ